MDLGDFIKLWIMYLSILIVIVCTVGTFIAVICFLYDGTLLGYIGIGVWVLIWFASLCATLEFKRYK